MAGARRREVDAPVPRRGRDADRDRASSTAGSCCGRRSGRCSARSAFLLVAAILGAVPSAWGILAIPAAGLCAAAFCAPLAAYSSRHDSDLSFPMIMRLGVLPLFLFSGTFFPIRQLPRRAADPSRRCRRSGTALSWRGRDDRTRSTPAPIAVHIAVLVGVHRRRRVLRSAHVHEAVELVSASGTHRAASGPRVPDGWRRRPWRLVERNVLAYRRIWYIFLSGFVEPLLFLLSIGIGVGKLVGDLNVGGQLVPYRTFVAPGLLAIAAMNGSVLDTTFNFFFKMKYAHTYDAVLATPLGAARRRGRRDHVGAASAARSTRPRSCSRCRRSATARRRGRSSRCPARC